jgi:hypothetical protein
MPEPSIHDNRVVSYEVDGERRRIVLRTQSGDQEPVERTDVIFEGVLAYFFQNDNFGNILFGIEEIPIRDLVEDRRNLFEAGAKYGWPGPWNQSVETSIHHLQTKDAKGFEISTSYGLEGWVVAESCRLETRGERAV